MRFSWKKIAVCASFMCLYNSIFAMTQQPKSLFFRVDLQKNSVYFGHFETQNHIVKAIDTQTLRAYNEDDIQQLIQNVLDSTAQNHKILVFIHGMWGNRQMTLNRNVPELENNYGAANDVVIHILWESQSLNERVCRRNARNSTPFVTPILRGVLAMENVSPILMCHSMGNYLLFELMDNLQNPAHRFEKTFLMAADVSLPVFEQKMDMLEGISKTTQVYYNRRDMILFFSGIANGEQRLGKKGAIVHRDFIEITDCTKEKNFGFIGRVTQHSYFKKSPGVRESLKRQINF